MLYTVEWTDDENDTTHERDFGPDLRRARDYARRKSRREDLAYVVAFSDSLECVGHEVYAVGNLVDTEGRIL